MATTVNASPPSALRTATAVLAGTAVGVIMVGVGVYLFEHYGAVLFLAAPLAMGLTATVVASRGTVLSPAQTVPVALGPLVLVSVVLVVSAVEGLLCLMMALPVALPLALLGGTIGNRVSDHHGGRVLLGLALLPAAAGLEATQPPGRGLHEVLSTVEIAAPADRVWANVVAFPPLDEPTEWWYRAGLAYPRYASIEGAGVGAIRYCVFSTGAFVEPITAWEPGRRLAFDVADSPPPMRELSPYDDVHAPHLDGYFRSRRGEFRLIPLPGGRTRLEGRTWYELDMAPAWYWEWVADRIIHGIHARVLDHVKAQAER
jgi:hypothetical protein